MCFFDCCFLCVVVVVVVVGICVCLFVDLCFFVFLARFLFFLFVLCFLVGRLVFAPTAVHTSVQNRNPCSQRWHCPAGHCCLCCYCHCCYCYCLLLVKKTKNNIAVCGWFVVCFVVNGIVVCLL